MIQLIAGEKGTGKTKRLIDLANAEIAKDNGAVVFVDDDKRYMYDISSKIRFVNVSDYTIDSPRALYGFLCGMLSQNFDITTIYIDAFLHMIKAYADDEATIVEFFKTLEKTSKENSVNFVFNYSCAQENMPEELKQYII